MKYLFFTGSRSEWGYIRPLLELCKKNKIKYNICATNMHLLDSFGNSSEEIEKDGFKISDKIYMALDGYNNHTMAKSMGIILSSFTDVVQRLKPDWIILAGDRAETLCAGLVGAYTYTPIAHIQAGELSGNIDGLARHAIGKFAHLHFASNKDAYNRLKKLGEEKFRIKLVGAPQLDDLTKIKKEKIDKKKFFKNLGIFDISKYLLVVYHPVTEEFSKIEKNFEILDRSLKKINLKKIWIMPNNDAGSSLLKSKILSTKSSDNYYFENLPRADYLRILKMSECIVGNSSSGIIESSTFKIPTVNIGRRQNQRLRATNVVDIKEMSENKIVNAIKLCTSKKYKQKIKDIKNPYGDGNSSKKIFNILLNTPINDKLLIKKLTY
jgi:GDP/UDP-N,N'-diacetylbacillosamine 2-epimerase (hydrolysing)